MLKAYGQESFTHSREETIHLIHSDSDAEKGLRKLSREMVVEIAVVFGPDLSEVAFNNRLTGAGNRSECP
ncbi:allophanate hydrolase subunit 1 [Bradyrhizobium sp. GM24.11]